MGPQSLPIAGSFDSQREEAHIAAAETRSASTSGNYTGTYIPPAHISVQCMADCIVSPFTQHALTPLYALLMSLHVMQSSQPTCVNRCLKS